MDTRKDDPKFRALLMRREEGYTVPEQLWGDGVIAPLDDIVTINEMHRSGRITFKEWLRYVREWTENVAEHYGTATDVERVRRIAKP
jgi:hypothetical protein